MSLTGLYLVSCVLITSKQLRFVLPDVRGYVARLCQLCCFIGTLGYLFP
ncbi:MAG: hypothetical protein ACK47N_03385 [Microcystis sp.]